MRGQRVNTHLTPPLPLPTKLTLTLTPNLPLLHTPTLDNPASPPPLQYAPLFYLNSPPTPYGVARR